MRPILKKTLRSRWFVTCIHVSLWLLVYLAVTNLGGRAPDFRDAETAATTPQSTAPIAKLEYLVSPGVWPKSLIDTNRLNPFFTPYFIPPAPPPPATTRKIEVTYQGFYQTGDDLKRVIFKLGEAYLVSPIGTRIATNLYIAEATMQAMILTNLSAQTNILPLNTKKEIVVPIQ
jgi:hypothetical protein